MTTITADGAAFTYAPAEEVAAWGGSPGPRQFMTTFTPAVRNGGVLVYIYTGGFSNLDPLTSINDVANPERQFVVDLYNDGWIIVTAGFTGNVVGTTQGMHSPYGGTRFKTFHGNSWWERDMWFLIQKIHQMIADGGLPAGTRRNMIGVAGLSASWIVAANIAFGPRENYWTSGSAQLQKFPDIAFLVGESPTGTWYPAFRGDEWAPLGAHFEASPGTPPSSPHNLSQVPLAALIEACVLGRMQKRIVGDGTGKISAPPPPLYMFPTEVPSIGAQDGVDANGYPTVIGQIRGIPQGGFLHDYWMSWILKRRIQAVWGSWSKYNRLSILPGFGYASPYDDESKTYNGFSDPAHHADIQAWVNRRLTNAVNPDWTGAEEEHGEQSQLGLVQKKFGRMLMVHGTLPPTLG